MNAWTRTATDIAEAVLRRAPGTGDGFLVAGLALLMLVVVLRLAGAAAGMDDCGWPRRVLAAILGLAVMLLAATAAAIYLDPYISGAGARVAVRIAATVVALLLVGLPLQKAVMRVEYAQLFIAFGAALITGALVIILTNAILDSLRQGEGDFLNIKQRRMAIEKEIGR